MEFSIFESVEAHAKDDKGKKIGMFDFYSDGNLREVVVYHDVSDDARLFMMRSAVFHACVFALNRPMLNVGGEYLRGYLKRYYIALNMAGSKKVCMEVIPENIANKSYEYCKKTLEDYGYVSVVECEIHSIDEAIKQALSEVDGKISYSLDTKNQVRGLKIEFVLPDKKNVFKFWKSSDKIDQAPAFNLHLVPTYHPVNFATAIAMINGATDANIRGYAVTSIYKPVDEKSPVGTFDCSWSYVRHPFFAQGNSFKVAINQYRILTQRGIDELIEILNGACVLNESYIQVSGGYYPSLPYPSNLKKNFTARGSEHHCVWEYRTLKNENALDTAYVPDWFLAEDWLEIYKNY